MASKKSQARHYAVQAIYQWQMTGQDIREVKEQFLTEQEGGFDSNYFDALLQGVSQGW